MPTVMRFDGFAVIVYPSDHRPAHVHVIAAGHEAVFNLSCPDGPVVLRENYGLPRRQILRIRRRLDEVVARLCQSWREIHGEG